MERLYVPVERAIERVAADPERVVMLPAVLPCENPVLLFKRKLRWSELK